MNSLTNWALHIHYPVQAILFDMDGVITNTMPDHFKAWKKVLAQAGIKVSYLDIYAREGQKGIESVKELFQKYNKPFNQREAEKILKTKEILFKKDARNRFIEGSKPFLQDLKKQGFVLALVTGTSQDEVFNLLPKSIINLFETIVTGSDVQFGKPHPEPYLTALKQLNLKPHEAVVIENAPLGIASAKAAKITCFALMTSLPKEYLKAADRIFKSIADLRREVEFVRIEKEVDSKDSPKFNSIQSSINTPLGKIFITASFLGIDAVSFEKQSIPVINDLNPKQKSHLHILKAQQQLKEYFALKRREFDLTLNLNGTAFQQKVWQGLMTIPFGQTISYKELALKINNPLAMRAVGSANGQNPCCIVVPCHRVIAVDGSLGGFSAGLEIKRQLLELEGKHV